MIPLVSVIMPAYNAECYIAAAIRSVLDQEYKNLELIIVNDGSTDGTEAIVKLFKDPRIRYYEQSNNGVSAARNVGLDRMSGDFFCFLDADDCLPVSSISSRVKLLQYNPEIDFADGLVKVMDDELIRVISTWEPKWQGNPLEDLLKISGKSFFGPSWMIRRKKCGDLRFKEELSHCEDLLFYMECARKGGAYGSVQENILIHREHTNSAMNNLVKLEQGYRSVQKVIQEWSDIKFSLKCSYFIRTKRIMFLSYLAEGEIVRAISALFYSR